MSAQFRCPQCKQWLTAPATAVGQSVECPQCRQSVMVQDFGDGPSKAAYPEPGRVSAVSGYANRTTTKRSVVLPIILASVGAVWVLGIVGLMLAFVFLPSISGMSESSDIRTADTDIAILVTQLDLYRLDVGAYPTTLQGLESLRTCPSSLADKDLWRGPYAKGEIPFDPWGNPYFYSRLAPDQLELVSAGPDGHLGTGDDIDNQAVD